MLNSGGYRHKITFCRQAESTANNAKTGQTLVPVRTAWASVRATGGTETYEMERLTNTVAYDVRTRFSPALLDPALIILHRGRRFEIRSVVDVREEHRELAFTCVEIIKAGESDHGDRRLEFYD